MSSSPTTRPVGATAASTVATARVITTGTAAAAEPPIRRPATRALRPVPTATVRATSSSGPATRTTGANGPAAWPSAIEASGTPPNGTFHRTSSASVTVPTRPRRRQRPAGTRAVASPRQRACTPPAKSQPGGDRSIIQRVDGRAHARPVAIPRRNREATGRSATRRSNRAMPTKAAGHQPHGGTAAAIRSPARTAIPDGRSRFGTRPRLGALMAGGPAAGPVAGGGGPVSVRPPRGAGCLRSARRPGCPPCRPPGPGSTVGGRPRRNWPGSGRVWPPCRAWRPG